MNTGTRTEHPLDEIYLDARKLQAGDVLLTCGPGKESWAIALFSRGEYSHAALLMSSRSLVEAFDDGVGYTFLRSICVRINGQLEDWVCLPRPARHAVVLRHPELQKEMASASIAAKLSFRDKLFSFVNEMCGLPYSYLYRLAAASSQPEPVRQALTHVLKWKEDRISGSPLPGMFCSELVAEVFRKLGIPLLSDDRNACLVSPNDLANEKISLLGEVEGAIINSESAKQAEIIFQEPTGMRSLLDRSQHVPQSVASRESAAMIASKANEFHEKNRGLLPNQLINLYKLLEQELENLSEEGDSKRAARVNMFLDELALDSESVFRWDENHEQCTPEDIARIVEYHLRYYRILRFLVMSSLAVERRLRHATQSNPPDLAKCEQARSEALLSLRNLKRSQRNVADTLIRWHTSYQLAKLEDNAACIDIRLPDASPDGEDFEYFRMFEEIAVKSDEVLTDATGKGKAQNCSRLPDPPNDLGWWRFMRLQVSGGLPEELTILVEAIADAYLANVPIRWDAKAARLEEAERNGREMAKDLIKMFLNKAGVADASAKVDSPADDEGSAAEPASPAEAFERPAPLTPRGEPDDTPDSRPSCCHPLPTRLGPARSCVATWAWSEIQE